DSLQSFVDEPHQAICSDVRGDALNLVSAEHERVRAASVELASGPPDRVLDIVRRYATGTRKKTGSLSGVLPFDEPDAGSTPHAGAAARPAADVASGLVRVPTLDMPDRHALLLQD